MRAARLAAIGTGLVLGAAAAAELTPVRVTDGAGEVINVAAHGTRLAWSGLDPDGQDLEIFWLDTALPSDPGVPQPCPLSNPCQVSENAIDDVLPVLSQQGVLWTANDLTTPRATLRFYDGAVETAIPGALANRNFAPARLSGARVAWFGLDDPGDPSEEAGLLLFDASLPAAGPVAPCPGANPCWIASGVAAGLDAQSGPQISGTRVVYEAAPPASGLDREILFFDAAEPATAGGPLACPQTNPCLLTANDVGDGSPVVSPLRVAWLRCDGADCLFSPADSVMVFDGAQALEVPDPGALSLALSDPWIVWSRASSNSALFDAAKPIALHPVSQQMLACPQTNPCTLPGNGPEILAGDRLLLSTQDDIPGPFALRLVDLRRPYDALPFAACPDGNPCIARDTAPIGAYDYSGDVVVWTECDSEPFCFGDPTVEVYYAVPEPRAAALAALLALAAVHGIRCPISRHCSPSHPRSR